MKNRYGHEIINFPQKRTFKKWILSLSKEERVKLEALPEQSKICEIDLYCNCPLAKFMQFYTGKNNVIITCSFWGLNGYKTDYKLPDWAKDFINLFDSGKIRNLREWASRKDS